MDSSNLAGLGFLVLLAFSSICLGVWSGQKRPALMLATGFLMTTALLVSLNLVLNFLNLAGFYYFSSFAFVVLAISTTFRLTLKRWLEVKIAAGLAAVAVAAAYLSIGVLHFRGAPSFDSTFVLSLAHLIQIGGPFELATDYFKRGLAYPVLHAFAELGHFAPMIALFIAALLGFLAVEEIKRHTIKLPKRVVQLSYLICALLIFTAPMIWNSALYLREHTLVALAIGVLFVLVTEVANEKPNSFSRKSFWTWLASAIVVSSSRPEGVAIAIIFVVAVYPILTRMQRVVLVVTPFATVSIWIVNLRYNALPEYLIQNPWLLLLLFLVVAALCLIQFSRKFLDRAPLFVVAILGLVLLAEFLFFTPSLLPGLKAQFANLVLQEGGYSFFMVAAVISFAISYFLSNFPIAKRALHVVAATLLLFLVAKTLDLGILKGQPDLGRVGIGDSLNRMWLHLLLPLATVLYFVVARGLQLLSSFTRGSGKTK